MNLPIYAINLDRSVQRWRLIAGSAEAAGLNLIRVPAVDGRAVPEAARVDVSDAGFRRLAGRIMRPGEYGCYQSHLQALDLVVASGAAAAVIAEDDVLFPSGFTARVAAILADFPRAEVVKLINHRVKGFRRHGVTRAGDEIGRCLHGPQGSAACYLVTASGAAKLARTMRPMQLPFDVELERGWRTGAAAYTVKTDIVSLGPLDVETEIGSRDDYRQTRLLGYQRLPTHFFRAKDYVSRMIYAAQY